MLAETYIALDGHLTDELHLDQEIDTDSGTTWVTWRGFTDTNAIQVMLSLAPAGDSCAVIFYDRDVEQELSTSTTSSPSLAWILEAIAGGPADPTYDDAAARDRAGLGARDSVSYGR